MRKCIYIAKFIPLRWSEFRNIKCEDVDYGYDIQVITQILTLKDLPTDQIKRLKLIETLYKEGLNSVEISDFLNKNRIQTPTGLQYDPKIVWVSHDKFQKRKQRINNTVVSVVQDYFYIKEGFKFWTE